MPAGVIAPTTPYCRACGWDFVRVETGADGICDSCGDLLINSTGPPAPPATGAVAGSPGSFTPVPSTPPADFAAMAGIIADPLTLWLPGESVTLGDASSAYWDGAAWQVGVSPAIVATGATAGNPGTFTPANSTTPADFAAMAGLVASPTSPWTPAQNVILGDASTAYWDGTAWAVGVAPAYATTATAGIPGTFGAGQPPLDFAGMAGVTASPLTLWTIGQSVKPFDASDAYWDGAAWQAGTAP